MKVAVMRGCLLFYKYINITFVKFCLDSQMIKDESQVVEIQDQKEIMNIRNWKKKKPLKNLLSKTADKTKMLLVAVVFIKDSAHLLLQDQTPSLTLISWHHGAIQASRAQIQYRLSSGGVATITSLFSKSQKVVMWKAMLEKTTRYSKNANSV